MAEELRYTVRADGAVEAAKDLDELADKAERIEGKTVEAKVAVDSSRAEQAIKRVDEDIKGLSDADKAAILKADARQLEAEIRRAQRMLREVDGDEATAVVGVIDNARANLDRINGRLDELDRKTVDVKVEADTAQAKAALDDLEGSIGELDGRLGALAGAGPLGIAAGLGAGVAALGQQWASAGAEVATMATLLGATNEEASKLRAAFAAAGVEANDVNDIVLQVNGVLAQQPELARQLGVTLGQSPLENFKKIVAATESIEDPMKRATLQSQLFGEEGVRQVAAVTAQFGSLKDAIAQVDPALVYNDEAMARAREFNQLVNESKVRVQALGAEIGKGFVESVTNLNEVWKRGPGDLELSDGLKFGGEMLVRQWAPGVALANDLKKAWGDYFDSAEDKARKASEAYLEHETAELGAERAMKRVEDQARRTAEALESQYVQAAKDAEEATRRFNEEHEGTPGAYERVFRAQEEHIRNFQRLVEWADRYRDALRQVKSAQDALSSFGTIFGEQDAWASFDQAKQRWMTENHEFVHAGEMGLDPAVEGPQAAEALRAARDAAIAVVRAAMARGKTNQQQAKLGYQALSGILSANPWLAQGDPQLTNMLTTLGNIAGSGEGDPAAAGALAGAIGGLKPTFGGAMNITVVQTGADPTAVRAASITGDTLNGTSDWR